MNNEPKQSTKISIYDFSSSLSSLTVNIDEINVSSKSMELYMDLRCYYNHSPFIVNECWSLSKVYSLCIYIIYCKYVDRSMGIRHLPVCDNENRLKGILCRQELQTDFKVDLT